MKTHRKPRKATFKFSQIISKDSMATLNAIKRNLENDEVPRQYRLRLDTPVNGERVHLFECEDDLFDFVSNLELPKEKFTLSWFKFIRGQVWKEIERWEAGMLTKNGRSH